MNKLKRTNALAAQQEKEWTGYSIDQLEQCRLVNAVKRDLIKEQLALVYRTTTAGLTGQGSGTNSDGIENGLSRFMTYAGYGMRAYKYIKSIMQLYRSFKN